MSTPALTPAVQVAIRILDVLAAARQPLTLSEIGRRAEAPKASAYRTLTTLCQNRLVHLEGTLYTLGPRVLEYSAAYTRQLDIVQVFQSVAAQMVEQIDETVQLARLEGDEVVFIAKLDCSRVIRPAAFVGRRVPAHATAVGKAMLAFVPETHLYQLYPGEGLPALTPFTLASRRALQADLNRIRSRGFAATQQESLLNLCCVSAPVRDATGTVVAALSVCMATEDPPEPRREVALAQLIWGAREISLRLGWFEPAPLELAQEAVVVKGGSS